jgi:hypothetical protein
VRILFMMKHPGTTRNFESTLRELARRGHALELAFESPKGDGAEVIVDRLRDEHPGLSVVRGPKGAKGPLPRVARGLRLAIDYLRYRERRYAAAEKLRERARSQAPAAIVRLTAVPGLGGPRAAHILGRALATVERALPAPPPLVRWIGKRRPDVLLVSPLVGLGSRQADYVRAARELGIPTGLLVHSWDNLTNKGLLRDVPDLVAVWNEAQAREAAELHAVPPQRVAVTGAPGFDHWFARAPSRDADRFAQEVGLAQDGLLLLYLCSSPFIAPDEVRFVRRWIAALRMEPAFADARVIVRPHPQNADQWADVELGDAGAAVWPRGGANPVDDAARADFYDSMHHASAVVGINTSALIEAAIVGRPVLTVLDPEFAGTQEGTLHFHHLAGEGGLLHVAGSLDEHIAQLAVALRPDAGWPERNRRFLEAFVRPYGLDRAAAPLVADAVERTATRRAAAHPRRQRLAHRAIRRALPAASPKPKAPRPAAPDAVDETRAAVRRLAEETTGPILAGPWVSEVGYELLYWVPFLRWAIEEHPGLAERLVVVSRGGSEHWYEQLGVRYADLFDLYDPDELRRRREEAALEATGGLNKQMTETPLDRELLAQVATDLGLSGHAVLHPSLMYAAYWRLVKRRELVAPDGGELFRYEPLAAPVLGVLAGRLPEEFVAVRFYFRASFPETAENVAFARLTVEALTEQTDVVLLNPSVRVDDHWDFEPAAGAGRVVRLDDLMTPRTNLAVQTAAVARAQAFVGTYGGLAYLAPLLGVRSDSVYSDPKRFKHHHGDLAEAVFGRPGFGRFALHDVRDLDPRAMLSVTVAP